MTELIVNRQSALAVADRRIQETSAGRAMTWYVDEQVETGSWREEELPAEVVGLNRPVQVYRAARKANIITYDWHGDGKTFCPPMWWDLAIGSGACGLGCRACFLMLTHRIKRDPFRHLLYDNLSDFERATERWLVEPNRRKQHTLGVGIDRSDSLLYEGATHHVRSLAPLFSSAAHNPKGNKLVLLTKTANTHYLADIPVNGRANVVVTFSLNPEAVADLWEGKWPDTGERISPSIAARLDAARYAQDLGFEVRVRIDPILTPANWEQFYEQFLSEVRTKGINFRYWTLGTYREKNAQLDAWRGRWGLPEMEWQPGDDEMVKEGTHRHLSETRRVEIYRTVASLIRSQFPQSRISLCKETHSVRRALALCNADCNCLI
jgi:DNA repair photolyase